MNVVLVSFLAQGYRMLPYGCAALSAYLSVHSEETKCAISSSVVGLPYDWGVERACRVIAQKKPDIVGISCYVWNYPKSLALVATLRKRLPNICIVLGGPQVYENDHRLKLLLAQGYLDHIVLGEGELALAKLVEDQVQQGRTHGPNVLNGTAPEMCRLPLPYRFVPELIREIECTGVAVVEGTRGCPWGCTFCDQGWRAVRIRDLDLVKSDLLFLYQAGARSVIFLDPTFNFDRRRMRDLLMFIKTELPGVRISAEIKVHLLRPDDSDLLASSATSLEVGLQSSKQKTLSTIRRPEQVDLVWERSRDLVAHGCAVTINTIFGLPGETLEDWSDTVDDVYQEVEGAIISATCLKILPNTEVFAHRDEYAYEYDQSDMFRAVASSTMSRASFRRAEQLSALLNQLQSGNCPIGVSLRRVIDERYGRSLTRFLEAFRLGEFSLRRDRQSIMEQSR